MKYSESLSKILIAYLGEAGWGRKPAATNLQASRAVPKQEYGKGIEEADGLWERLRAMTSLRYNYNMDKVKIKIPKAKIAAFCKRWNVSEFAIFGSALGDNFRPDSDVDILVSFAPQAHVTLFEMALMQEELKAIFGRDVDLVSKRGVETSRNYLRRKAILESARVIHVA